MLGSFYRQDINIAKNLAQIRAQYLKYIRPYRKRLWAEVELPDNHSQAQPGHALYEGKHDVEDGQPEAGVEQHSEIGEMPVYDQAKPAPALQGQNKSPELTPAMADKRHTSSSEILEDLIAEEKDPQKRVELEMKNIALNEPDIQSIQGDTPAETPRQPISLLQQHRTPGSNKKTPGVNGSALLRHVLDEDDLSSIMGYRDPSIPRRDEEATVFSPKKKIILSPVAILDKPDMNETKIIPVAPPPPGQRQGLPRQVQPKPVSNPSPQTIDEDYTFKQNFPEPKEDEKNVMYYLVTPDGKIKDLTKEGYDSKSSLLGGRTRNPVPKLVTKTDIRKLDKWLHGSSVPAIGGGRVFLSYSKPK